MGNCGGMMGGMMGGFGGGMGGGGGGGGLASAWVVEEDRPALVRLRRRDE